MTTVAYGPSHHTLPVVLGAPRAVRKREIDVLVVWRYDRFTRSTQALIMALGDFQSLRVDFVTLKKESIFTIMAGLAEFESVLISERVRDGMNRSRAPGKRISRQTIPRASRDKIEQLRAQGKSLRLIAREVGVSVGTVGNYVNNTAAPAAS